MSPDILYFLIFTALAFVLFITEVFVPGGVIGALGGVSMLVACVFSFKAFGPTYGALVSMIMILLTLAGFMFWLMKMPESRIGKTFSLQTTIHEKEPSDNASLQLGMRGTADTDLRPGGFARFSGKKTDVVASSGYIERGTEVEVVDVQGSSVVVRPVVGDTA